MHAATFIGLPRQKFRRYFQPSRIAICVMNRQSAESVNLITISFNMHCSYSPPMMAFSIQKRSLSYELARSVQHCVLSIPGELLAKAALYIGTHSGRDVNKVNECGLTLVQSEFIPVPGILQAIANIEMEIVNRVSSGDHMTLFGKVLKYGVNTKNSERCLISVGPEHDGYEVLASKGIHRIAVARGNSGLT